MEYNYHIFDNGVVIADRTPAYQNPSDLSTGFASVTVRDSDPFIIPDGSTPWVKSSIYIAIRGANYQYDLGEYLKYGKVMEIRIYDTGLELYDLTNGRSIIKVWNPRDQELDRTTMLDSLRVSLPDAFVNDTTTSGVHIYVDNGSDTIYAVPDGIDYQSVGTWSDSNPFPAKWFTLIPSSQYEAQWAGTVKVSATSPFFNNSFSRATDDFVSR